MLRGEIWWANLPRPVGSEPGFRHPVLVVQADDFNSSRIRTVLVVILTSNLRLATAPGNVLISAKVSGLPRDSVANVSQLFSLDRSFFTENVGYVPNQIMQRVENGLRLILDL